MSPLCLPLLFPAAAAPLLEESLISPFPPFFFSVCWFRGFRILLVCLSYEKGSLVQSVLLVGRE